MFQGVGERNIVRLTSDAYNARPSEPIEFKEKILTGRLLADGQAIVVGDGGTVYGFDSLRYGDCCTMRVPNAQRATRIAAGNDHVTAVLERGPDVGGLVRIFDGSHQTEEVAIADERMIRQMAWSASNQSLALAGEATTEVIRLSAPGYQKVAVQQFSCGHPVALNSPGTKLACIAPESGKVQYWDVLSRKLDRELDGHLGPVQSLVLAGDVLTAGGTYSGRSQTLVTVWNASTGVVISEQFCPVEGLQEAKPFGFLKGGSYFAQLDTPDRVVMRDTLTCEVKSTANAMPHGADRIRTAALSDSTLIQQSHYSGQPAPDLLAFSVFDRSGGTSMRTWPLDLPVDDVEISLDGKEVVVQDGGRLLRIPITDDGELELAAQGIEREFTKGECEQFFPGVPCPSILRR